MAGGMRIDDHKSWLGSAPAGKVFPDGPHKTKMESSAEGVGQVADYQDTTEKIRKSQVDAGAKVKGHQGKLPEYRN